MDRPQATASGRPDKHHRLYPSLPSVDRYDICVLEHSSGEKLQGAAQFHPDVLLEEAQSEESAANSDIRTKAQILILEEQRQELLCINERWAKEYRTMAQYYKEELRVLKALLQQNRREDGTREEGEPRTALCKKLQFSAVRDNERLQAGDDEEEVKALRAENCALTRAGRRQQEEIKRLNKALQEMVLAARPPGCSETLQDLWKHQAEVYKEDFLKERKDREKLMEKYLELKKRFRKIHTELYGLKSQWTSGINPQPEATELHVQASTDESESSGDLCR